jgi:hypothetical protein
MSVFNSINVSVLIVLLVAGLVVGLSVSGIDLLNPNTSAAEANLMSIEAAHKDALYKLEETKRTAQTDAELRQIQREQELLDAKYEHEKQRLTQDLTNRQRWTDAAINLAVFFGKASGLALVLAAMGAVIASIVKAIASARSAPAERHPATPSHAMPEIQIVHPLPERQSYEPLDWSQPNSESLQELHDRRLEERMREITQPKETDRANPRMRAVSDPARMSSTEYHKRPLAGD